MKRKTKNTQVEGKLLRQQFTEELQSCKKHSRRWPYMLSEQLSGRLGQFCSAEMLLQELGQLLKQYDDMFVQYYPGHINIHGHGPREGVRPGKVHNHFTLYVNEKRKTIRFYSENQSIGGENIVELLDCMDRLLGKHFAILIQDDTELFEFYHKYTEWFAPYSKLLNTWRNEFMTLLLNWVKSLILSIPEEEPCTKNVQYNLMGILHKLKGEIEEYRLTDGDDKIVWVPYGVRIRADKELWVLQMDTETFNCLEVQIRHNDSGKQAIERKLTDNQIIQILIQLIEMLGYSVNPYCILFRFALCRYMQEYVLFVEDELNDDEVMELLKQ